jgi:hypothetical protein
VFAIVGADIGSGCADIGFGFGGADIGFGFGGADIVFVFGFGFGFGFNNTDAVSGFEEASYNITLRSCFNSPSTRDFDGY